MDYPDYTTEHQKGKHLTYEEVDIMNYISVKAASEKWGISERRIQKLCEENRIDGTEKFGRAWMIPKDAEKPVDGRMKTRNKQEENHGI